VARAAASAHIGPVDLQATLSWIEQHPGLAAWVQGVGTLLAILAAAGIALWQADAGRRGQARRATAELRARREAAALITATIAKFVGQFSKTIGDKANLEALPHIRSVDRAIQGYYDDLALIPLGDLHDGVLCERVLVMRSHMVNMLEVIENLRVYVKRGGSAKDEIGARVEAVGKSGAAVVHAAEEFRQRLDLVSQSGRPRQNTGKTN
jgi:hypothetical protein